MTQNIKNKKYILDTSALIALLQNEPGSEIVRDKLNSSLISSVSLCELVAFLSKNQIEEEDIEEIIKNIVPDVVDFNADISILGGKLIKVTQNYGLSLGDRACIATGIHYGLQIYTADKIWSKLNNIEPGIVIIR
jgi:PIN domain nuclease of toxin-antitoxin system